MKIKIEIPEETMINGYRSALSIARQMTENGLGLVLRAAPGRQEIVLGYGWTEVEETDTGFAYVITLPQDVDWGWYGEQVEAAVSSPTAELAQNPSGWVQPVEAGWVTIEV